MIPSSGGRRHENLIADSDTNKNMVREMQAILSGKQKRIVHPVKTAVVDFQSPEIGGEFDVSHFRCAVVADAVARIIRHSGFKVLLKNQIGAWSKKFCILLQFYLRMYRRRESSFNEEVFEGEELRDSLTISGQKFQNDSEFKIAAEALHRQYVDFHVLFIKAWPLVSEFSRKKIRKIYTELGVILNKQEDRAHLYFNPVFCFLEAENLIKERKEDWHINLIDEGDCLGHDISHLMEGFNHILTDMTALWYRLNVEKAEWIIYITPDQKPQKEHWETVVKLAERAKWLPGDMTLPKASHICVGLACESDTIEAFKLVDILGEAKRVMRSHVKNPDPKAWNKDRFERVIEDIACAAAKYVYLQADRCGNDKSDYVRMLNDRKCNIYLLDYGSLNYRHRHNKEVERDDIELADDLEWELGSHLMMFAEAVEAAHTSLKPSLLCEYLHRLIELFISVSADCKDWAREMSFFRRRCLLCEAATTVTWHCFDLLGILNPMEVRLRL